MFCEEVWVLLVEDGEGLDTHEFLVVAAAGHEFGKTGGCFLDEFLFRVDCGNAANALVGNCKSDVVIDVFSSF